jgi:hypothetical protein
VPSGGDSPQFANVTPGNATILVHDWYRGPGIWQAASVMRGLALKIAYLDRFEVVENCEDDTDWRNELKLDEAEIVDDVRFTGCGSSSGTGGTNGTSAESPPGDATQGASGTSTAGGQCGSIELRTAKAYFFEAPKEPANARATAATAAATRRRAAAGPTARAVAKRVRASPFGSLPCLALNSVERRGQRSLFRCPSPISGEGLGVRGRVGEWQDG